MILMRSKKKVPLVRPKKKRLKLKKSPSRISWGEKIKEKGSSLRI